MPTSHRAASARPFSPVRKIVERPPRTRGLEGFQHVRALPRGREAHGHVAGPSRAPRSAARRRPSSRSRSRRRSGSRCRPRARPPGGPAGRPCSARRARPRSAGPASRCRRSRTRTSSGRRARRRPRAARPCPPRARSRGPRRWRAPPGRRSRRASASTLQARDHRGRREALRTSGTRTTEPPYDRTNGAPTTEASV